LPGAVQILECGRCFLMNRPCIAVSGPF
jgi:hypothetical protein